MRQPGPAGEGGGAGAGPCQLLRSRCVARAPAASLAVPGRSGLPCPAETNPASVSIVVSITARTPRALVFRCVLVWVEGARSGTACLSIFLPGPNPSTQRQPYPKMRRPRHAADLGALLTLGHPSPAPRSATMFLTAKHSGPGQALAEPATVTTLRLGALRASPTAAPAVSRRRSCGFLW